MFRIAIVEDTIRIEPHNLGKNQVDALTEEIHRKYANRVLQGIGLCLFLFDFVKASEGIVRWGDGCLYHHCTFRMVVFRPFVGEVLEGRIKSADEDGIRVSMQFFDDIYILPTLMPDICAFDHHERAWFWVYQPPPDPNEPLQSRKKTDPYQTDPNERLYLSVGEPIRFVIEDEEFHDPEPGPTVASGGILGTAPAVGLADGAKIGPGAVGAAAAAVTATGAGAGAGVGGLDATLAPPPDVGPASAVGGNVASAAGAPPGEVGTGPNLHQSAELAPVAAAYMDKMAPFILIGSIAAQGLGHPGWWEDDQGEVGGEADVGMAEVNGHYDGVPTEDATLGT